MNRARNRLICAKVQLAKEEKRPKDLIPQLRDAVQMWENEWTQVKQLYEQKLVSMIDEYFPSSYLLDAKLRLAQAQGRSDVVRKVLSDLVRRHETILKQGRRLSWGPYSSPSAKRTLDTVISARLNRDTRRLEEFLRTGLLNDDLTLGELDP